MKYVMISQHVLNHMPRPYHVETIDDALERTGVFSRNVVVKDYEEEEKPSRAQFGTGLFRVEADGQLTLVDSDWDTSD